MGGNIRTDPCSRASRRGSGYVVFAASCAILINMDENHHIWRIWANFLHRWGLQELTASLLEAFGPLTLVGAQAVFMAQPLLTPFWPAEHLEALAQVLEDTSQKQAFLALLRESD